MRKALAGLKVLDVSRLLAGPYCSMLLADLGADVIKVEVPVAGDDARRFGPFRQGESGYFMTLNRNKRGMTLDLRKSEGQEVFRSLAANADIILENFAVGTMEKWGLGYDEIAKINPQIIYASISGFGQQGPASTKVAFDAIAQAMGGLMSLTGYPGTPPTRVGVALGDINAGVFTTVAILAALHQRQQVGHGERIDMSMQDCIVAILENAVTRYTMGDGEIPTRIGSGHASIAPYDVFAASDGYVFIACANEATWRRLCKAMGNEALIADERFEINDQRAKNATALKQIIEEWVNTQTIDQVLIRLEENAVPAAPVQTIDKLITDQHLQAREMIVELEHPVAGKTMLPGNPFKLQQSGSSPDQPSPTLGQHTEQVLREAGFDAAQIEKLRQCKII